MNRPDMTQAPRPKAAVLISGGVDSSLALALLCEEGRYEVHAFYLKIWLEDEMAFLGTCPWEEDLEYARATTDRYGIPLEVIPLQRAYHDRVVGYALDELKAGRTPSPDLMCNSQIKFGAFADAIGDDYDVIVTGHYAVRQEGPEGAATLHRAPDPVKDQTYFLARLAPEQLARARFPIGHLKKHEVRVEAEARNLPSCKRPDSQGICFLGRIPYPEFVRSHLGDQPGPIVDVASGKTLGQHRGLWFNTIGQRKGLGLGGGPWFVVDKDPDTKTLLVAHASDLHAHEKAELEVESLRWLSGEAPDVATSRCPETGASRWHAKIRHGPQLYGCVVSPSDKDGRLRVQLDAPETGIAPGQFAVFYEGTRCLGSGIIA